MPKLAAARTTSWAVSAVPSVAAPRESGAEVTPTRVAVGLPGAVGALVPPGEDAETPASLAVRWMPSAPSKDWDQNEVLAVLE